MNTKNITKTGLNNFIGKKVNQQKKELNEQIRLMIDETIDPILKDYINVKNVETHASKLADEMLLAIEKYKKPLGNWKYQNVVSEVNRYAVCLGQRIKEEIKSEVLKYVENPQKGNYDFENEILNKAVKKLQDGTKPFYNRISELTKLKNELEQVIKNEHNGGRAYKALIALGVDMEEYEETGVNLPAIINLSVDVCVLNGDCEKKAI